MKNELIKILKENNWKLNPKPATTNEIDELENKFGFNIPEDYKQILLFSNGGSIYGFQTPLIIYSTVEVLSLYYEFDYYQDIPESLIFGGDGGGTIYAYDLRDTRKEILFFRLGDARYDNIIYKSNNLSQLILDIISNKKIN